jgi:hypothetical protein
MTRRKRQREHMATTNYILKYVREHYSDTDAVDGVGTYDLIQAVFEGSDANLYSDDDGEVEEAYLSCERELQEALRGSEFVPRMVPDDPDDADGSYTEAWFHKEHGTEYAVSPQWESGLTPSEYEIAATERFLDELEDKLAQYPDSGAVCMRDVDLLEQYGVKKMSDLPEDVRPQTGRRRSARRTYSD